MEAGRGGGRYLRKRRKGVMGEKEERGGGRREKGF